MTGTGHIIGERMPDGTVYAGISPDTKKPIYAARTDAPLTLQWKQALEYAAKLDAHGHDDWRVPTKSELKALFSNRASIGGFDESGSGRAAWYWSSSQDGPHGAWVQSFSDGNQDYHLKFRDSSLRCVR